MRTITVTAADVSLYHVAARELGDATQWWRLAVVNGIADPMLAPALVTLSVPDPLPGLGDGLPPQE